jgi:hypothetical protein
VRVLGQVHEGAEQEAIFRGVVARARDVGERAPGCAVEVDEHDSGVAGLPRLAQATHDIRPAPCTMIRRPVGGTPMMIEASRSRASPSAGMAAWCSVRCIHPHRAEPSGRGTWVRVRLERTRSRITIDQREHRFRLRHGQVAQVHAHRRPADSESPHRAAVREIQNDEDAEGIVEVLPSGLI